jgi:hypothetical protein
MKKSKKNSNPVAIHYRQNPSECNIFLVNFNRKDKLEDTGGGGTIALTGILQVYVFS